jgi:hypothetical protein
MRCVVSPEGVPAATQRDYAEVLAVHAALLHTGKVVYFSGDEHDAGRHPLGMFDHARLFNRQSLAVTSPVPCCGHACLADGGLLVAGGTEEWTIEQRGTAGCSCSR